MKKFTLLFSVLIILSIQLSVAQRLESSAKYAENPKTKPAVSPLFLHSENNVISKEIMCMNDALFSNAPVGFTTALTSNTDVGYIVAQYVKISNIRLVQCDFSEYKDSITEYLGLQ